MKCHRLKSGGMESFMNNCWFMDWVEIDGTKFFYSPQLHSIMRMGIKEEAAEIERQLLDAEYSLPGKYITIKRIEHKLFLLPLYGQSICIYDLKKKNIENLQLDEKAKMGYSIFSSVCVGNKIIGVPGRYSKFVIVDGMDNSKTEIEFDKEKLNENKMKKDRSVYFTRSNYVHNDILFVGSLLNNYIVSISLNSYQVEYYEIECINEQKKGIYTLCGNGKELYVLGNDSNLRIYEILQRELFLKKIINILYTPSNSDAYANSLYMNGKMIIFSNTGIIICDIYSGKVRKSTLDIKNKVDSVVNSIGFLYARKSNNIIRTMSANDFVEYSFDEDMNIIGEKQYYIDDDKLGKMYPCPLVEEQGEVYIKNLKFLISCLKR